MCNITAELAALKRPGLLVKAATLGTSQYQRRRDLRRMLRAAIPASPKAALETLLPLEASIERRRLTADRNYSFSRHVDVLVALLAEAQAFRTA